MTTYLTLALLTTLTLLSTGCTGLASVAKQLKDDPAFVTVDVRTLYGTGRLVRDGRVANGNNVTLEAASSIQPPPGNTFQSPPTQIIYVTNTVHEVRFTTPDVTPTLSTTAPASGPRRLPLRAERERRENEEKLLRFNGINIQPQ